MTPDELRNEREARGLSQNGLARALGLGTHGGRTVRRWELGERAVPNWMATALKAIPKEK